MSMVQSPLSTALGQFGVDILAAGTGPGNYSVKIAGDWAAITTLANTVFMVLRTEIPQCSTDGVSATMSQEGTVFDGYELVAGNFQGREVPAGVTIYGRFKAIKLTSGAIIAYRSNPNNDTIQSDA